VNGSAPPATSERATSHRIEVRWLGRLPYDRALTLQQRLVAARREGAIPDQLLMLEHPHVITLGSNSDESNVLADPQELARRGIQRFDVGRGGDVTYHGPGQLVGYPILDLKPDRKDLHRYLRDLEDVLIRALGTWGVVGEREPGLTGVWVGGSKIAAIGVRVSSGWVTSHGFALNVSTDLDFFGTLIPCGLSDRGVTSLEEVLERTIDPAEVRRAVVQAFGIVFGKESVTI
jgi:lipoyl(octanoyl) transferase